MSIPLPRDQREKANTRRFRVSDYLANPKKLRGRAFHRKSSQSSRRSDPYHLGFYIVRRVEESDEGIFMDVEFDRGSIDTSETRIRLNAKNCRNDEQWNIIYDRTFKPVRMY